LTWASQRGHTAVVVALLEAGADVETKDDVSYSLTGLVFTLRFCLIAGLDTLDPCVPWRIF